MRPSSLYLATLILLASASLVPLGGCSAGDCVPVEPSTGDAPGDPYEGWQDITLSDEIIEVTDAPWGESYSVGFSITNEGNADLTIESAALDTWSSDQWEFDASSLPDELERGESVEASVTFHNTSPADSYAALSIFSNDPDQARISLGLIGRSTIVRPQARITPSVLDFGYQYPGQSASETLTVSNGGDAAFTLETVTLSQPAETYELLTSTIAIQGAVLEPGATFPVELAFTPTGSLLDTAQFSVTTDDPQRPSLDVALRGNGSAALGCTAPSITMDSPSAPFEIAIGEGNHLEITATVSDAEQPPSGLLIELLLGSTLIEDEFSGAGGAVTFDIDLDDYEVEDVWEAFPQGVNTFTLRVTDACPRSSELRFVAAIGVTLPGDDGDGDGYPVTSDCDDGSADSYPGATELEDGQDNDCDGAIDNSTASWDNDCDGYCSTPPCLGQGPALWDSDVCDGLAKDADDFADCDDRISDSNHDGLSDGRLRSPATQETQDFSDQDCDGQVDEGTTYFDDDGDGLTEFDGDCDDENPDTGEHFIELCDEGDNDCDGTIDEDCIEILLAPRIVGDVLTDHYEVSFGAAVEAHVVVPNLTYAWETDLGGITSDSAAATIVWEAPEATQANLDLQGTFANLHVTVTDSAGRSTSAFGVVRLASDEDGPGFSAVGTCGCATLSTRLKASPLVLLLVIGLGLIPIRRSRQGSHREPAPVRETR